MDLSGILRTTNATDLKLWEVLGGSLRSQKVSNSYNSPCLVTMATAQSPCAFCFDGGSQLSEAVKRAKICSGFWAKKFLKFLTFLYCFTSQNNL